MRGAWLLTGIVAWCAIAAYVLVPPTRYAPGPVLRGHASFELRCATCHTPWRGPGNNACISCHGDFIKSNPHASLKLVGVGGELDTGKPLPGFANKLRCLSCHTEHLGRRSDVSVGARFACAWCHTHRSIEAVAQHQARLIRPRPAKTMFPRPFSHSDHASLLEVDTLDCRGCHNLTPTAAGREVAFSIKWKGCAASNCHVTPQDLGLPASVGKSPDTIRNPVLVRHIDAVFMHSPGHLRTACADCHTMISQSGQEIDTEARTVMQCFKCHAHQQSGVEVPRSAHAGLIVSIVNASTDGGLVTACGACHLFHGHGPVPTFDFVSNPPKSAPGIAQRPTMLTWWPGLLAALMIGVIAVGTWRLAPTRLDRSRRAGEGTFRPMHELPNLDDQYQSNLRGLYIIGETAGTASINFAMRSGREVISAIADQLRREQSADEPDLYDVAIVGCGPAGLGASLTAASLGLKYLTLEKLTPASTIRTFPRAKFVQATPISLEEYGSFFLEGDNSKEELIAEWEKIIGRTRLVINSRSEVVDIRSERGGFSVITSDRQAFGARTVVLAIGVRGTPRRLGLPGEEPGRVLYSLIEPDEFKNRKVLVIGGGNAGAEVVQSLSAPRLGNQVSYSIREPALSGVTRENSEQITALQRSNAIRLYASTVLTKIGPGEVVLRPAISIADAQPAEITLPNDVIFAMIGAELPTGFLKSIGVRTTKKGAG
jgi:thioredoxin reductase (NADPH)